MAIPNFEDLLSDFELLDDWEDRYKYVIELGHKLPSFPEEHRTSENKVQGCASQVWLQTWEKDGEFFFIGDSDALIVKGLIAVLFSIYSGKKLTDVVALDAKKTLNMLDLQEHLTSQRSNGLFSMVERINKDANFYQTL